MVNYKDFTTDFKIGFWVVLWLGMLFSLMSFCLALLCLCECGSGHDSKSRGGGGGGGGKGQGRGGRGGKGQGGGQRRKVSSQTDTRLIEKNN